jgi:hypothetical protein
MSHILPNPMLTISREANVSMKNSTFGIRPNALLLRINPEKPSWFEASKPAAKSQRTLSL